MFVSDFLSKSVVKISLAKEMFIKTKNNKKKLKAIFEI